MTNTDQFCFEAVPASHFPLIRQFYKQASYFNQVGRKDEVYCLRDRLNGNAVVAAVRLVKTADYLILRSMVVSPACQRQGLGKFFLQQVMAQLENRTCWCYPFEWLEDFYRTSGFISIQPEKAPLLIHTKYQQYLEQGRKLLIMRYSSKTCL